MATALQRIAVIQIAGPEAIEEGDDLEALERLAETAEPAFVQLLYQIAITSRRDLSLAPDDRLGFEMAMLRMLTFRPQGAEVTRSAGYSQLRPRFPQTAGTSGSSSAQAESHRQPRTFLDT